MLLFFACFANVIARPVLTAAPSTGLLICNYYCLTGLPRRISPQLPTSPSRGKGRVIWTRERGEEDSTSRSKASCSRLAFHPFKRTDLDHIALRTTRLSIDTPLLFFFDINQGTSYCSKSPSQSYNNVRRCCAEPQAKQQCQAGAAG